jgi:hypothetical protein
MMWVTRNWFPPVAPRNPRRRSQGPCRPLGNMLTTAEWLES